jgi:hypothetical protein
MKRLLSILPLAVSVASAQCVMCFRTAAAQQMERAKILNFGILIMLIPPIVILAGFLLLAWRRNSAYADLAPGNLEPHASLPQSVFESSPEDRE